MVGWMDECIDGYLWGGVANLIMKYDRVSHNFDWSYISNFIGH